MTESLVPVGIFLLLLALLPLALKWMKQRSPGASGQSGGQAKFVSALAVGPHQRVVTVEVGPQGQRVWLTLGVTAQGISCLHCANIVTAQLDGEQVSATSPVNKDLN
jgi:flagellar protein FliO/FliZ